MLAGAAAPRFVMHWQRNPKPRSSVGDGLIQLLKSYVERPALGTGRLLVVSNAFDFESLWDWLVQYLLGRLQVFRLHLDFDSANEVGKKPIHPHHVVVSQKTFDPC